MEQLVRQGTWCWPWTSAAWARPGQPSRAPHEVPRPERKDIYLAYLLGTSYLAMRAEDVLVAARFLASTSRAASRGGSIW